MTNTISSTAIDFIGDIHGHADELEELLTTLRYEKTNGYYKHAARKAFFVGDFIDRGPQIREVLEIVRPMIDNGSAYTVIGNHEYNAICYWTIGPDGMPLREHSAKNMEQHERTIESFSDPDLLAQYVDWFKTLPIYFEHENFRVTHAQWKVDYIQKLKEWNVRDFQDAGFLIATSRNGSDEFTVVDCLLKGEEIHLPGITFEDKGKKTREHYRIKWWHKGNDLSYKSSLFEFRKEAQDGILKGSFGGYAKHEVPVFFGHYWLKDHPPMLQECNVCCLDFSVAKEGNLVAYQWNGERELVKENFEYVKSKK